MRVRVDPTKCQGYAVCAEIAPDKFTFDDWGFAQAILIDIADSDAATVDEVIRECPAKAIRRIHGPASTPTTDPQPPDR
jgi:ferredoxin